MDKKIFLPLAIIVVGLVVGGILLFGGNGNSTLLGASDTRVAGGGSTTLEVPNTKKLRKVDLEILNMFCIGCRSSVVNSVMAVPGVVQADADPGTDSGWVIYDSDLITKEGIVAVPVFQAYPARIIADSAYSDVQYAPSAAVEEIPSEITDKLDLLAQRIAARGVVMESFFQQELDDAISGGYWGKVNNLLDNYLEAYE